MICSLCQKVALYTAGPQGFCGDHRDEARRTAAQLGRHTASRMAVDAYRFDNHVSKARATGFLRSMPGLKG